MQKPTLLVAVVGAVEKRQGHQLIVDVVRILCCFCQLLGLVLIGVEQNDGIVPALLLVHRRSKRLGKLLALFVELTVVPRRKVQPDFGSLAATLPPLALLRVLMV